MSNISHNADRSKYPTAYWPEYSAKIIASLSLKLTSVGEYHGSCPNCGGKDRFWIKEQDGEVKVFCRQCEDFPAITEALRSQGLWPGIQERAAMSMFQPAPDFPSYTPYHTRKGVELNGALLDGSDVVVPIYNSKGEKIGAQTIKPNGDKRFTKGLAKEGAFGVLNGPLEGTCYIAEGWATAASVSQSTGRPAVFALDAGNLPKVAKVLAEIRPDAQFIVAADNDEPGIKAAKETGLLYVAPSRQGDDWNDVFVALGPTAVAAKLKLAKRKKDLFVQIGELTFSKPKWIINGWLEQETFAVAFGKPAAGKTFVVLDMALCVASGKDFHGRSVEQGPVFYIAGEGHNGFARRCAAWSKANGVELSGLPFYKSNRNVVMTDPESVEELHETVANMAAKIGKPRLIVVDTLARAMGAADENSTQEMGAFIRTIDDMRDEFDCTFLAVHHTGHGNQDRARGSSSLLGAVDAEMRIEKKDNEAGDIVLVECTKMKDAQEPEPQAFIHRQIDLIDADLEETSSVVLEPIDYDKSAHNSGPKLSPIERIYLKALDEARGEKMSASADKVRDIFENSMVDEKSSTKRQRNNRETEKLKANGVISISNSMVYLEA